MSQQDLTSYRLTSLQEPTDEMLHTIMEQVAESAKRSTAKFQAELHVIPFDDIVSDFYGTPGAFDDKMLKIRSKDVVYIGSLFEGLDKRVIADRRVILRMQRSLHMHRSREWKKDQIYKLLQEFAGS